MSPLHTPPRELPTLVHTYRWWAETTPDAPALAYYENGIQLKEALSIEELDRAARDVAGLLQERGLQGKNVVLLFPPGLEFVISFLGCLYAGAIAVPAYPPEPHRLEHTMRRLHSIIADARAPAILTSRPILAFAEDLMAKAAGKALTKLQWLTLDQTTPQHRDAWTLPDMGPDSLSFLQYTSGSTSAPKGVMITHGNLVANLRMAHEAYQSVPGREVIVCWLPLYHDMGLIGCLLNAMMLGSKAVLMPPQAFLKKPLVWLDAITRHRGTITAAPNFAYDLCLRKITPEERDRLDLSSLKTCVNGAEPVRRETVHRFLRFFESSGLNRAALAPSYGMAEVGVFVSTGAMENRPLTITVDKEKLEKHRVVVSDTDAEGSISLVSSGQAWLGSTIDIVHPETRRRLRPGQVGEIWVRGDHVAAGYWNRTEQTEETFAATLNGEDGGPFLRTGDLGFLDGGELFVTGRRKDLLIIRGRNLYPHDIEKTMDETREACPQIRPGCSVATSTDIEGEERLVVFQEVDTSGSEPLETARIMETLRETIGRIHEIQPHAIILLERGSLPKTSSGKVMRHACRKAFKANFESGGLKVLDRHILGHTAEATAPGSASTYSRPSRSSEERDESRGATDKILVWLDGAVSSLPSRDEVPPHLVLELARHGIMGMRIPKEYGGLSLGMTDVARVLERLGALCAPLAQLVSEANALGAEPLLDGARSSLADEILPELARGDALATLAIADSSSSGARPNGEGCWTLQAELSHSAASRWAHYLHTFSIEKDADDQPLGLTGFTVSRDRPGYCPADGRTYLRDLEVTTEDRLAPLGSTVLGECLERKRFLDACAALGVVKKTFQRAVDHASRTREGDHWLLDTQATLERFADHAERIARLETLLARLANAFDDGHALPSGVRQMALRLAGDTKRELDRESAPSSAPEASIEQNLGSHVSATSAVDWGRALRADPAPFSTLLHELGGAKAAERLASLLDSVVSNSSPAKRGSNSTGQALVEERVTSLLGEIAACAVELAAMSSSPVRRNPFLARALENLEQRWTSLEEQIEKAPQAVRGLPSARTLAALAQSYQAQTGPVESVQTVVRPSASPPLRTAKAPRPPRPSSRPQVPPRDSAKSDGDKQAKPAGENPKGQKNDEVFALKEWMVNWIAKEMAIDPKHLREKMGFSGSAQTPFSALGIDSVTAIQFVAALEEKLRCPIPQSALWDHDNIDELARHLIGEKSPSSS